MFQRARDSDLPYISELIREGARAGGFDAVLATDCAESRLFFKRLAEVVTKNVWIRGTGKGAAMRSPAALFLYRANTRSPNTGFVAIRGAGQAGFELWLAALDPTERGRGLGRKMLTEFLATPEGKVVTVAQCGLDAEGAQACAHILAKAGFVTAREGNGAVWLARADLPASMHQWLKTAPFTTLW